MKFEYVASGCSFLRIVYNDVLDHLDLVNDYFSDVNGIHNHNLSLLFNAHTESKFGGYFEHYKRSIYKVHADSGGLQLSTGRGVIPEDVKKQIYKVQAAHAHVGMSFDNIPVLRTIKNTRRGDVSGRYFDRDHLKEHAKSSGINIRQQIESYIEDKTTCEPYVIIHGNDVDTALEWTEILLDQVPEDLRGHIGGLAMGGGSFGTGQKEAFLRAFLAGHIMKERDDLTKKKIHFLGLGSLARAFPFLAMMKSGHYLPEWSISYDSTTHTGNHHVGNYLTERGKMMMFGRVDNNSYTKIYDEICRNIPTFQKSGLDRKVFHKILNSPLRYYIDEEGGNFADAIHTNLGIALSQIVNFVRKIEIYSNDLDVFLKDMIPQNEWPKYLSVSKINSLDTYRYWDKHVGRYIESKPTPELARRSTLDEFE